MNELIKPTISGTKVARRTLLRQMVTATGLFLVTPTLVAACGSAEASSPPAPMATSPAETAATAEGATATCAEEEGLSSTDQSTRAALGYVAHSTDADKQCANCHFFKQAERAQACGGCQILQGPIARTGYCNSWVKQRS